MRSPGRAGGERQALARRNHVVLQRRHALDFSRCLLANQAAASSAARLETAAPFGTCGAAAFEAGPPAAAAAMAPPAAPVLVPPAPSHRSRPRRPSSRAGAAGRAAPPVVPCRRWRPCRRSVPAAGGPAAGGSRAAASAAGGARRRSADRRVSGARRASRAPSSRARAELLSRAVGGDLLQRGTALGSPRLPRPSIAMSPMMSNVSVSASLISTGTARLSLLWPSLRAASRRFSFHVERSMSAGWFSISLISAGTSAGCAGRGAPAAMREHRERHDRARASVVSEPDAVDLVRFGCRASRRLELVAGRRRDAVDHEPLRDPRHARRCRRRSAPSRTGRVSAESTGIAPQSTSRQHAPSGVRSAVAGSR